MADDHDMQTLTTAMGPLMDPRIPSCVHSHKTTKAWSKYIHGASAVFAWHIVMGEVVTVLCPPPPDRFHPSGLSYFQIIEEPILRAAIADGSTLRIDLAHPRVKGAEDFRYPLWPHDETDTWLAAHGSKPRPKFCWRAVKTDFSFAVPKKTTEEAAPEKLEEERTEPAGIQKVTAKCQQAAPKKSKKKKKGQKKQASFKTVINALREPDPTTQSEAGFISVNAVSQSAATKPILAMETVCSSKRVQPSKRERRALRMLEFDAVLAKTERKAAAKKKRRALRVLEFDADLAEAERKAAKATEGAVPDISIETTATEAAVSIGGLERVKAQGKEANLKEDKQPKKKPKKSEKELKNAQANRLIDTEEPVVRKPRRSLRLLKVNEAIVAFELQYMLNFGAHLRFCV
ncbi:hypothetical protein OPT61_g1328 [Boeremia exigua]|uniref:Uncharacterized protein n=1 Tax=Boeremia exigua TaxID=749465 RepID=A0ACC2IQJ9_9PLEO|nr:hypothetical protein OPT61_g1328 [Boeremia exigua]